MEIISRSDWNARTPRCPAGAISGAVDLFFVHHSVTNAPGPTSSRAEDAAHTRLLQDIAFGREFCDISYSWIAYKSGRLAEGRGWGRVGAHTQGFNSTSYAVCLAGNYERDVPTDAQVRAVQEIIAEGKRLGHIKAAPTIRPHRAVSQTSCPGANVMAVFERFSRPPEEGEIDLPLTTEEVNEIAAAVWRHSIAAGDGYPEQLVAARHVRSQSAKLNDLLARPSGGSVSVDEQAIAAAIAAALGPELAAKVAAELSRRLAS